MHLRFNWQALHQMHRNIQETTPNICTLQRYIIVKKIYDDNSNKIAFDLKIKVIAQLFQLRDCQEIMFRRKIVLNVCKG